MKFFYFIKFSLIISFFLAVITVGLLSIPIPFFNIVALIVVDFLLIPIISAVWVYRDSKKLQRNGVAIDSPITWSIICLLSYSIGLGLYLAFRKVDYIPQINTVTDSVSKEKNKVSITTIILIIILITVSVFAFFRFKNIHSQNIGMCEYKNSKFDFKFDYNCKNLSMTSSTADCEYDKMCRSFDYNKEDLQGLDYSIINSTVLPTEKESELILQNNYNVKFYKFIKNRVESFCSVIPLYPGKSICFKGSFGLDTDMTTILQSFNFY